MNVDSIRNGYVIDHIQSGRGMDIYKLLNLSKLDCPVAMIMNVPSDKMGKKDIIKIDGNIDLDMDVLGFVDPDITINEIRNGEIVNKQEKIELPERIVDVVKCKNPRCITTTEQELPHIFKLTNRESKVYRCIYCEAEAKKR